MANPNPEPNRRVLRSDTRLAAAAGVAPQPVAAPVPAPVPSNRRMATQIPRPRARSHDRAPGLDALDGGVEGPPSYAQVASTPPSRQPSPALGPTTAEPNEHTGSNVAPVARAAAPVRKVVVTEQVASGGTEPSAARNPPRKDSQWETVPMRSRSRSLDSFRTDLASLRSGRIDLSNRFAFLPPSVGARGFVGAGDDTLQEAEANLTSDERDRISRRYNNTNDFPQLRRDRPSGPETPETPPSGPADKGKGPDVRNWGFVHIPEEEADPEIQAAMLASLSKKRQRELSPARPGPSGSRDKRPYNDNVERQRGFHVPEDRAPERDSRRDTRGQGRAADMIPPDSTLGRVREAERRQSEREQSYAPRYAPEPEYRYYGARQQTRERSFERDHSRGREDQPRQPAYEDERRDHPRRSDTPRDRRELRPTPQTDRSRFDRGRSPSRTPYGRDDYARDDRDLRHNHGRDHTPREDERAEYRRPYERGPDRRDPYYGDHDYGRYDGYDQRNDRYDPYWGAPMGMPLYKQPTVPLTAPKTYDGSEDLKAFTIFRNQCTTYCRRGRVHPREQVEVISPFLDKKAQDFYINTVAANPSEWTLTEFLDDLFSNCFAEDYKSRIRAELQNNRQGSSSVRDYAHDVLEKLDVIDLRDPKERVHKLWFGFEPHIQRQLWLDRLDPERASWEEVVRSARAAEKYHAVGRAQAKASSNQTNSHHDSRSNAAKSDSRSGKFEKPRTRVDGNHHNGGTNNSARPAGGSSSNTHSNSNPSSSRATSGTSKPAFKQLTQAEKEEYLAKGMCFRCRGFGHLSRNCPQANVVRSKTGSSKPPGMSAFNVEMGFEDVSDDDEFFEVLDEMPELPMHALGMDYIFDPPEFDWRANVQAGDCLGELYEDVSLRISEPSDQGILRRESVVPRSEMSKEDFHLPLWMDERKADKFVRNQIGDALAMRATYVLNVSQPYPGDKLSTMRSHGIRDRFGVHKVNNQTYGIIDRCHPDDPILVPKYRLEHQNFRVARWYARFRNFTTTKRPFLLGSYPMTMGDAYSEVACLLLTDGIKRSYPNVRLGADDDSRFEVGVFPSMVNTYAIVDADRGVYTLCDREIICDPKFNLIRWYQLVLEGKRGLDLDTFPLPDFEAGEQADPDSDSDDGLSYTTDSHLGAEMSGVPDSSLPEHPIGVKPMPFTQGKWDDDDMPELQSISDSSESSDSESASDDEDIDPDFENVMQEPELPIHVRNRLILSRRTENELSDSVSEVLLAGAPYPGDPRMTSHLSDRFEILPSHSASSPGSETHMIFDHLRNEVQSVPLSELRNPSFNVGLWYAEICARRAEIPNVEQALVRWQKGRPIEATLIGRGVERRLEFLLRLGQPYPGDASDLSIDDMVNRFSVQRDPRSHETLVVTDHHREIIRMLPSEAVEAYGFDAAAWFEAEYDAECLRKVLLDDVETPAYEHNGPSLFGKPTSSEEAYVQVATSPSAWERIWPLTSNHYFKLALYKRERDERERLLCEQQGRRWDASQTIDPSETVYYGRTLREESAPNRHFGLFGVQIPSGSYPSLQRNAASFRGSPLLVPKPIVVTTKLNAEPVRALLDSGSLGDFISSNVADQLKLKQEPLAKPIQLQLAVTGSRSSTNSRVKVRFQYQTIDEERWFHVINVSNYDLILGTPFLYQHQVCVGLNPARVVIGSAQSQSIPSGVDTKPVVSSIHLDGSEVTQARKLLEQLAEPLCKEVEETGLPPLRAINHTIPLIDESVVYPWRPSRCPEVFRKQWAEKRKAYLDSGRWEVTSAGNTVPMLLIPKPKKDKPELRTVFDLRARNKNTKKLTSPLPDIDGILRRVSKHPFRSTLDLKAAYEQIRVVPEHVHRTAVTTPDGNIVSHVVQQGDCNAPATYQALMNHLFSAYIGVFLDVYLDDIIIYSNSLDEHVEHVRIVLRILEREQLYLSKGKLNFIAEKLEILGRVVDDQGIRMDPYKVDCVINWKVPTNRDLLRGFIGSVGYLADDIPGVRIPMGILSAITGDAVPFRWTYTEQRAFEDVKRLVQDARDHHRVPLSYEDGADPIWMVTDGCSSGISGVVSQGSDWRDAKVAAFYSAKLNPAQQNYPVHEIEMLAGIETMLRHRDILQGAKFTWITDHKGLERFWTQKELSGRQARWVEKIGTFDFVVRYVPGEENVLADTLSRLYSYDAPGTVRARSEYTYHDVINDDLVPIVAFGEGPMPVFADLEALAISPRTEAEGEPKRKRGRPPKVAPPPAETGRPETAEEFAKRMVNHFVLRGPKDPHERKEGGSQDAQSPDKRPTTEPTVTQPGPKDDLDVTNEFEPLPDSSLVDVVEASTGSEGISFLKEIKRLSTEDTMLKVILEKPEEYRNFAIQDGLVYLKDRGKSLLCIPKGLVQDRSAREIVISEAHSVLAHLGAGKTTHYLRDHVFWKDLVKDVKVFCDTCHTCKQNKPDNQRPYGFLNPLSVASAPWDAIGVDFVGPLPESSNRDGSFDSITVVIDLFSSMVHLVPSRTDYDAKETAELMFEAVYKLHGLPRKIISDRDVLFTSTFWQHLNALIGPKLKMSSAYHPETDGATERANRTMVQMLRELVNSKQSNWVQCLPSIEFAMNSARSESTGFAPFFLNTGRMPRSMIWNSAPQDEFPAIRNFALTRKLALMSAHDSIIASRVKQTRDANKKRRLAPFSKGDLVYVSTKNISFPKGLARKLVPRYIGPYRIVEDYGNQSFKLELSSELKQRGVHDVFHASLLRIHSPNDDRLFPGRSDTQIAVQSGNPEPEWAVDKILSHAQAGEDAVFEILWKAGDITWLPYHEVSHLPALRAYLTLLSVEKIGDLPHGRGQPPRDSVQALLA